MGYLIRRELVSRLCVWRTLFIFICGLVFAGVACGGGQAHDARPQRSVKAPNVAFDPLPIDEERRYGPAEGKKIKLFILSGQSNMVGQGVSAELPRSLQRGNERVLMFEDGKWQPLRPLRNFFGPEIAFGQAISRALRGETIGIVKQAVGGTGVLAWNPNWTKEKADLTGDGRKGDLWKALTDKVRQGCNAADCEVMGFVWQQGGKDMKNIVTGRQYLANLTELVEGLRKETGESDLPFVLGSYRFDGTPDDLTDFDPASVKIDPMRLGGAYVLKAQWDAQTALAPAKTVVLRGLERHPQNVHYNTNGQLDLGRLLAEGYLELASNADKVRGAFRVIEDDPALPRALIIGDSISIGYTVGVRGLLDGKVNVHRVPENCAHTTKGLEAIDEWLGEKKWDVIHFNWGLHDLKYVDENYKKVLPEDGGKQVNVAKIYAANLEKLVKRLKKTGAGLIFATTTPVVKGAAGRIAGDSVKYNVVAERVMRKHGVAINDLYSLALAHQDEIQKPANVHFEPEGSEMMAEQVAAKIVEALPSRRQGLE